MIHHLQYFTVMNAFKNLQYSETAKLHDTRKILFFIY